MATAPLPKQTVANDILIAGTPYAQLTQRQKDYAAKYGVGLMPAEAPPPAALAPRPATPRPMGPEIIPNPGATSNPLVSGPDGATHSPTAPTSPTAPSAPTVDPAAAAAQEAASQAAAAAKAAQERAQRDAFARLKTVLDDYGLGSLAGLVQQWVVDDLSEAEILQRMRETDQFKTRFPAIEERKRKGLPPLSPGEYVAYERQARQVFRQAGLPQGFYDGNDDFTRYLTNDVSLSELTDRIGLASNAAFNADPATRQALAQYGFTGGEITAFFLDPDVAQPLLERKYNSARLSAAGQRSGFGFLAETEAVDLLQSGVTESGAAQGFSEIGAQAELFNPLDVGEDSIGRQEQLDGTFKGNSNARRRIQQRQRRRIGAFEGGGAFAAGERGVSGLGEAD